MWGYALFSRSEAFENREIERIRTSPIRVLYSFLTCRLMAVKELRFKNTPVDSSVYSGKFRSTKSLRTLYQVYNLSEGNEKVAILQSNYIPWKGYFDMIAAVDEFILYDDMQYTRRDWRNRNQIKTPQGVQWLTVPVLVKGKYHQKIRETEIDGTDWATAHWKALAQNYRRAPHFSEIASWLEPLYLRCRHSHFATQPSFYRSYLQLPTAIKTAITSSWDYTLLDGKTGRPRNVCVCKLVAPSTSQDRQPRTMSMKGFPDLRFADYSSTTPDYPAYPQL